MESPATQPVKHDKIPYMQTSTAKVFVLGIVTFGLYQLLWFYRNWTAIKKTKEPKIWPFWRAVFSVFFAWPLFKYILSSAREQGFAKKYSAGWLAFVFAASTLIGNGLGRYPEYHLGVAIAAIVVLFTSLLPVVA